MGMIMMYDFFYDEDNVQDGEIYDPKVVIHIVEQLL